ncbi:MAG: RNA polymerase sigma factor [Solirubrobacteraceae bacterium]
MARTGAHEKWSDAELLAAIADRDREACAVFYRRHLPRVVSFLLRETGDPDLSADLTAEVFASVIVSAGRYRPQTDTAGPWLAGIARNLLGISRRHGRVQDKVRRRLAFEPIALDDGDRERTEALAARGQGRVMELVQGLPAAERDAVTARVLDERPYPDIASELECSELVVRKRVSRGLGRVRRTLEGR